MYALKVCKVHPAAIAPTLHAKGSRTMGNTVKMLPINTAGHQFSEAPTQDELL